MDDTTKLVGEQILFVLDVMIGILAVMGAGALCEANGVSPVYGVFLAAAAYGVLFYSRR